jgi:hypothetical protein
MPQILHIFKKDIRHQAPQIAALLILVAVYAWAVAYTRFSVAMMGVLPVLLPLGWWYLIAVAVHEECLPGDRQYWLTRPFSWKKLLAAKLLFVFAIVNVPLILAHIVILRAHGLSFSVADLFWNQVSMSALLVIPGLVLAAITRGMKEIVLSSLAVLTAFILYFTIGERWMYNNGIRFDQVEWIRLAAIGITILLAGAVILFLQYSWRRTIVSSVVAISALVLCGWLEVFFGVNQMFFLQAALPGQRVDGRSVRLSLDSHNHWKASASDGLENTRDVVRIELPIQVEGLPQGAEIHFDRTAIAIDSQNVWHSSPYPLIRKQGGAYYQAVMLQRPRVKSARIHFEADLTLFDGVRIARIPVRVEPAAVADVGACGLADWPVVGRKPRLFDVAVYCQSPFRLPNRTTVQVEDRRTGERKSTLAAIGQESYAPYPVEPGINPLITSIAFPDHVPESLLEDKFANTDFVFSTQRPVAHLRREFDVSGVNLMDYVH